MARLPARFDRNDGVALAAKTADLSDHDMIAAHDVWNPDIELIKTRTDQSGSWRCTQLARYTTPVGCPSCVSETRARRLITY